MGSSRLPGKTLEPLGEWTVLDWVVRRAQMAERVSEVIVATSTNPEDDAIEALINMLQLIANAVIWFVVFALPVLLIILIPFVLIIWLIRRLRGRERAAVVPTDSTRTPPTD